MSKYFFLVFLFSVSNKVLGISITEVDGKFDCPNIHNQQECAMKHEALFFVQNESFIEKQENGLKVKLLNGEFKFLENKNNRLNVLELSVNGRFLTLREQYWEGNTWHVLDLLDGKLTETMGYPLFSPSGTHVVCANQDLDAGYTPNIFDVYDVKSNGLVKVFKGISENDKWGPGEVEWTSNNKINFLKIGFPNDGVVIDESKMYLEEKYILENVSGKWLTSLKKSEQ